MCNAVKKPKKVDGTSSGLDTLLELGRSANVITLRSIKLHRLAIQREYEHPRPYSLGQSAGLEVRAKPSNKSRHRWIHTLIGSPDSKSSKVLVLRAHMNGPNSW